MMKFEIRSPILKGISLLATAVITIRISKWLLSYVRRVRSINKMKGPQMLPLIGCLHLLKGKRDWLKQLLYYSNKYKDEPVWRAWFGWNPVIMFHKPEAIEMLLSNTHIISKPAEYDFFKVWLKEGLITSDGEKWQARRRLLTPAFHFEILEDFLPTMNEQADIMVEKIEKYARQGIPVDILKVVQMCAFDIISETSMGQHVNAQNEESDYVNAATVMGDYIMARIVNPLLWPDWIFNMTSLGRQQKHLLDVIHTYTREVVRQRNAEQEAGHYVPKRAAFLDILLKAKRGDPSMTLEDVQEEVDTFMFTGFDSTAATACWACHFIGLHPHVQKRLHEEIDRVLGDSNKPLNKDDLKQLEYLECTLKETLRILPSVPFFGRLITEDIQIGDYKIEKGVNATILIYSVHRDERYWPDPERFDPDRFLPENSKDRHAFAYIPFAAGKRNCIGQRYAQTEEKVLLAHILRRFEIHSPKTTDELVIMPEVSLRSLHTMYLDFKPRFQ